MTLLNHLLDNRDDLPEIRNTPISGNVLRSFFNKRAVLHRNFLELVFGLQDDQGLITRPQHFSAKRMKHFQMNQGKLYIDQSSVTDSIEFHEVYNEVATTFGWYCRPTGIQIINYIFLLLKSVHIAARLNLGRRDRVAYSEQLDKAQKNFAIMIACEPCDSLSLFYGKIQTELIQTGLRDFVALTDPLNSEKSEMVRGVIELFEKESVRFCRSQWSHAEMSIDMLEQRFLNPDRKFKKLYDHLSSNDEIFPFWLFGQENPQHLQNAEQTSDPREFTALPVFQDFKKLCQSQTQTGLKQILRYPNAKKAWSDFTKLTIIFDPYEGNLRDTVEYLYRRKWRDQLNNPNEECDPFYLDRMIQSVEMNYNHLPVSYLTSLMSFLNILISFVEPIPNLEEPEKGVDLGAQQPDEVRKPLEERIEERRLQFGSQLKESQDNSMIPILLLGGLIFLMAR